MKPQPITESELMAEYESLRSIQAALHQKNADTVPPDWRTVDQWAEAERMSRVNAGKILRAAAGKGLVEMREFRIATASGVRSVQHFRSPQKKGKR